MLKRSNRNILKKKCIGPRMVEYSLIQVQFQFKTLRSKQLSRSTVNPFPYDFVSFKERSPYDDYSIIQILIN